MSHPVAMVHPATALASTTDADIIARSWDEPRVFEEIFSRHHHTLYRHLARRVGPDAAADIASETFVQAFAGRYRYRCEYASARPWLFGIATNLLRQHLRSVSRATRAFARVAGEVAAHAAEADDVVERIAAEAPALLATESLKDLHPRDREVLLLYAFGGLTYREAASALGVPIGTVRSRLARARRQLRSRARPAPWEA